MVETTDTSGDETEVSAARRRVSSDQAYNMRKFLGANELGHFFVTTAGNAAGKPSDFYCRACRSDVSMLRHGPSEILRHFQGTKHFPELRGKSEDGWISGPAAGANSAGSRVGNDREHPFLKDIITEGAGTVDVSLQVIAKVSALLEALRLGGSYELV